ncbi:MAG: hypothetical protein HOQ36_22265, partial [Nocardia sp.]|nr:hypothetical protein [Nocardia sp.]
MPVFDLMAVFGLMPVIGLVAVLRLVRRATLLLGVGLGGRVSLAAGVLEPIVVRRFRQ